MLPAESASSAATYWDKLLRHHWQALEKEEGAPNRVGNCLLPWLCSPARECYMSALSLLDACVIACSAG